MTEQEVRAIAEKLVADSSLDPCFFVEMRKLDRSQLPDSTAVGYEWIVDFQFEGDESYSAQWLMVVVDDATGKAEFIEGL